MATETKEPTPTRIDLHQAVAAAERFFRKLYPQASNLLLEEVEESEGKWLITLGFDTERLIHESLPALLGPLPSRKEMVRVYKTFIVDAASGSVRAMKMHPSLPA
jgi:hypothetical protein